MEFLQKKLRLWFWYGRAWIVRHKLLSIIYALSFTIVLLFGPTIAKYLPKIEPTYTEGIIGTYDISGLPDEVLRLISRGITKHDDQGVPQPDLAISWETDNLGSTYNFHFPYGQFWTDGTQFNISDLSFPFADVEVHRQNEQTLEFKLKNPFAAFPSVLAKPVFKKDTLIGFGPYKVDSIQIEQAGPLSFFTKENLFATQKLAQLVKSIMLSSKTAKPARIKFIFYSTEEKAKLALKLGEVQAVGGLANFADFEGWKNLNFYSREQWQKMLLIIYNTKDPLLSDRQIRQALTWAIPPQDDQIATASSPISKNSWAYNSDIKRYIYNADEAKKVLDRAEQKEGSQAGELRVTLSTIPSYQGYAAKIKSAWEKLGFKVDLDIAPDVPQRVQDQRNFQALLIGQIIPDDPDQYSLWHSTQKRTNLSGYSSPRNDKLLEDGRRMMNQNERRTKYFDFQRFLVEDAPAAFLYYPKYNFAIMKKADSRDIRQLKGLK